LNSLQGQISAGRLKMGGELASKELLCSKKASKELPAKQFENIAKTFQIIILRSFMTGLFRTIW
jgi:hypothetical protein